MKIVVVGGGIFGLTGALALLRRGHEVQVVDPGPIPHPLAASTDISKLVRADYGADAAYTALMESAWPKWLAWNGAWPRPLLHPDGLLVLSSWPLAPGSYEGDSFATLTNRGHALQRLDAAAVGERFPRWASAGFAGGYLNPNGGWAESGAVVAALAAEARAAGLALHEGIAVRELARDGERVVGVVTAAGERILADAVVIAAGAWTPSLVPGLADRLRVVGQPVFHLAPPDPERFRAPAFPAWAADIGTSGWYGFPANADGLVKIANHGGGVPITPDAPREIPATLELALAAFLEARLPELAAAPIVGRRLCLYCDSFDGDLWIDADPDQPGLFVAAGGSGHGFKFAPILGDLIADAVEGRPHPRFAWRSVGAARRESARAGESDLAGRWGRLWRELGALPDPALYRAVMAAWAGAERVYHGVTHLRACLASFDGLRDLAERPAEVELALWFHDAIYAPAARDNEARSAAWAAAAARDAGLDEAVAERVAALILATAGHEAPTTADGAVMLDADLTILGAPPAAFAEYEAQIRAEYAAVPDAAYRSGRAAVLASFRERPRIFSTDRAHRVLEAQARANLGG